jgi:tagatose 1,6-diphosphate aldolase
MEKQFSVGKLRGLQQIADQSGIFAMCAMDHRGSMQRMINPSEPGRVSARKLIEYKTDLTEELAPLTTAVLLDPEYGAAQSIARGVLPGSVGLLVSLEETGYELDAQGRVTSLLPDWSVEKIKRMGASAVKILLYYRPDLEENAAKQRTITQKVAEDCVRADIPFLIEPITYTISAERNDAARFALKKPELVIQSARALTPLGIDVLKAEFPVDMDFEQDEGVIREACQRLDSASLSPWILLSAGVDFDTFARQVKIACQVGASGFLGGRAIWEDAMYISDARERREWLSSVGRERLRILHDIAGEYGKPWWKKWKDSFVDLAAVDTNWYQDY